MPYRIAQSGSQVASEHEGGNARSWPFRVVALAAPDLPMRLTVLGRLVEQSPLEVEATDTLQEIATRVPTNLRQLDGALTRVVAVASITSREPTAELAREALQRSGARASAVSHPGPKWRPTVPAIQDAVCTVLGISRDELLSPSRSPKVTQARHLAMYLTRELTDATLPAIGRAFGGRNHTTVLHACRRTAERIADDPSAYDTVQRLHTELRGDTDRDA